MKNCFLWLTLRLLRKQRLRTWTFFCSILFTGFLLHTFCQLSCYFWEQVHGKASETAVFDSTQRILTALAAVLLITVFGCSAVFMRNLCLLAFEQKRQSLMRLFTLGADKSSLLLMTVMETCIITAAAVPSGWILSWCAMRFIPGIKGSLTGSFMKLHFCTDIWLILFSFWLELVPVLRAIRGQTYTIHKDSVSVLQRRIRPAAKRPGSFVLFMVQKYRRACRRHYLRITIAAAAAVILYVPASYLISTNLKVNRDKLTQKFGIEYTCLPKDQKGLQQALTECRRLIDAAPSTETVLYVKITGETYLDPQMLSSELLTVLKKAGWQGGRLHTDSDIYFLEDACYYAYVSDILEIPLSADQMPAPAVLANRYINRTGYREDAPGTALFPETPLLNSSAKNTLNETFRTAATAHQTQNESSSCLKIYCGISDSETAARPCIFPSVCCEKLPEGIRAKTVTVILPLSQMPDVCTDTEIFYDMEACALFADTDETLYTRLVQTLEPDTAGRLENIRLNYSLWYDSLHDIHLAMRCICGLLFFTALLNVSCTMLFHCMQRRHAAAILWSLGAARRDLALIQAMESMQSFIRAMPAAISVSWLLCCCIYRIYRPVWQIPFQPPFRQLVLITALTAGASAAATAAGRHLTNRQDFLNELRDIR